MAFTFGFAPRMVQLLVALLALVFLTFSQEGEAISPRCGANAGDWTPIDPSACQAHGYGKAACLKNSRRCYCQWGSQTFKWTAQGCGSGDGGCRCSSSCVYKCKAKCTQDTYNVCRWNAAQGVCENKFTLDQGIQGNCIPPSAAPTTLAPSASPTMSPSKAPQPPSPAPTRTPGAASCQTGYGVTKDNCMQRIAECNAIGYNMKWVGSGCVINNKRQGDGGCQCKGYCGYTCESRCSADPECVWSKTYSLCLTVPHNMTGVAIKECPLYVPPV